MELNEWEKIKDAASGDGVCGVDVGQQRGVGGRVLGIEPFAARFPPIPEAISHRVTVAPKSTGVYADMDK